MKYGRGVELWQENENREERMLRKQSEKSTRNDVSAERQSTSTHCDIILQSYSTVSSSSSGGFAETSRAVDVTAGPSS